MCMVVSYLCIFKVESMIKICNLREEALMEDWM